MVLRLGLSTCLLLAIAPAIHAQAAPAAKKWGPVRQCFLGREDVGH